MDTTALLKKLCSAGVAGACVLVLWSRTVPLTGSREFALS